MKLEILFTIVLICLVAFSGCINETDSSEQDNNNNGAGSENNDQNSSTVTAGWYLKEVLDYGDKENITGYWSYDVSYTRGNITTMCYGDGGEELIVRTTWTAPPEYIEAESEISIDVIKKGLTIIDIGGHEITSISIDSAYMELGLATASLYRLSDETYGEFLYMGQGDESGTIKECTFKANAPAANSPFNGEFGLRFQFVNGLIYGTIYVYEWKE